MILPNRDHLIVEERKILEYLLNEAHPDGASKAAFFRRHGFSKDRWQELANALREHGRTHRATMTGTVMADSYRYYVQGPLACPDERSPWVRTVWIIEGELPPRLITAYPARRR